MIPSFKLKVFEYLTLVFIAYVLATGVVAEFPLLVVYLWSVLILREYNERKQNDEHKCVCDHRTPNKYNLVTNVANSSR